MAADRNPAKRLRVAMLYRGGVRNHPRVLKEAATLADEGHRVVVVAMKVAGETRAVERVGRVVIVRTQTGFVRRIGRWLRRRGPDERSQPPNGQPEAAARPLSRNRLVLMLISRALLAAKVVALTVRVRPRVIHAHDFGMLPAGVAAATFTRARLIYDAHEVNVDREGYYRQLRWLISRLERVLIRRCDAVITTTELRARHFRRYYRLRATPLVLQNRPPLPESRPQPCDLRARLRVPPDDLVCIYQGGLQEGRGLRNLIEAVARVAGVHCVLVGSGHQADALRCLAERLAVTDRVHFLGRVPLRELPRITAAADVGVQVLRNTCFNHWSTDSNKLFEYALAGLPVIASNFPEIRRIIEEFGFGLLVNPESVTDISGALERLRREPELRVRMRDRALASAQALCWESQAPALRTLYATFAADAA